MRNIKRYLAMLLCLCLLVSGLALADEMETALTDVAESEVVSAPVEAVPVEEELALQPDAPEGDMAVSAAEAGDDLPKAAGVKIDAANFPDAAFRAYVMEAFDNDYDGSLSSEELTAAKTVECYDAVTSMKGIEYFTQATRIFCTGDELRSLDLRKNTKLKELYCYDNLGLKSIDLTGNPELEILMCDSDPLLTKLDVSHNTKLKELYCFHTGLKKLDIRRNPNLQILACEENGIKSLDISKCPKLVKCYQKGSYSAGSYNYGKWRLCFDSGVQLYTGPVSKVTITKGKEATIQVGGKLTLKAKLLPAGATSKLTWKSSNTKVATVSSSGVVKAKKKGTAKITVKTANGKKATIKITVKAKPVEMAGWLGKDVTKFAKQFGLTLKNMIWFSGKADNYIQDYYGKDITGKNKKLSVYAVVTGDTKAEVSGIKTGPIETLKVFDAGYSLFGVTVGMKTEEAKKVAWAYAKKNVPQMDSFDEYDKNYFELRTPGTMYVGFSTKNGKISSICYSYGTPFA